MMIEPKLRFKADDGSDFPDWESSTVGELFTFVTEKNESGCIGDVITNSAEYGLIPQREYFDKDIAVEGNTEGYTVIHKGDFVYNPRKSTIAPFGPFNIYARDEAGIVSPLYTCLTPRDGKTAPYLSWYFKTSRWHRYIVTHGAQGGARHDRVGMTNILMKGIPITLPSLPEQRKIADLLSAVDDVIAAQEAEVAAWEKRKKGVMQKLFSQEVRFKADDGSDFPDWEEQKIEDVCVLNPRTEQLDDEFYYMDLGSIDHGRWEAPEIVNKVDAPSRAQRVAAIDDVFFQSVRPYNMGHYHYVAAKDKQVVASTGYIQARMRNGSNAFLYQLFYEERFNAEVNARCTGSNYPAINSRKFGEITVALPSHPEQRKIADCLSALDDVIIKAKNELAKWQELKKGLLQQMFV